MPQIRGVCSAPTYTNGIAKALITVYSNRQNQYVLFNLLKEIFEFKEGKTYRITIEEE